MTVSNEPIAILRDFEARSRQHAAGLPQQVEIKQTWEAIGFRIGDMRFVAPLDEVSEILTWPTMARVPGSKSWVKGIANIRGNLLPIMDLSDYLNKGPCPINARSRVLVVTHGEVYSGLLVEEVIGLKHFVEEERSTSIPPMDDFIRSYIQGAYAQGGEQWPVFSMYALAESPIFMQAAV